MLRALQTRCRTCSAADEASHNHRSHRHLRPWYIGDGFSSRAVGIEFANLASVCGFLGLGRKFFGGFGGGVRLCLSPREFCAMSQADRGPDLDVTDEGSDSSLIRRFRAGEDDAATKLYKRYAERLQRLAQRNTALDLTRRFDAEDVVQSVFRTFFRRVRTGLYDLPAGDELWRLLLVISLNKIRTLAVFHRAQKRSVGSTVAPGLGVAVATFEQQHRRTRPRVVENGHRRSARQSAGCSAANDRAADRRLPGRGDCRRDGQVEADGRASAAGFSPAAAGNY